uniref:RNA polymerase sigma factor n=1 Tax=Chryseobacterium endophyticum TaxID=1854762 RepID=A0AAU6WPI4_9FLAO
MQNTFNWQKIYLDYSPKLLGICRRYIPDIYTAEDIVQDSFITAIQKNGQLNNEKALFAWLKKIVVNNALQHLRKHSKDTFVTTEPSEIPDTYSEMDHSFHEEKTSSFTTLPVRNCCLRSTVFRPITDRFSICILWKTIPTQKFPGCWALR